MCLSLAGLGTGSTLHLNIARPFPFLGFSLKHQRTTCQLHRWWEQSRASMAEGKPVWQPGSGLLRDGSPLKFIWLILQSTLFWPGSYVKTVCSEHYLNGAQGPTACAVYATHWKLYSCILQMGRRKRGRGAEITSKKGNVPAKASRYTLAKSHFFNCHSSGG